MRGKKLLAGFLVGVMIVCLVPVMGYGEIPIRMELNFLYAKIDYIMRNPNSFLNFILHYDPEGAIGEVFEYLESFPDIDTKGKILVVVLDNRGVFSNKSGIALLEEFEKQLEVIYWSIQHVATDMDTDIEMVAVFFSRGKILLGYFYQGEYYLWEE